MALRGVRVLELAGLAPAPFCGLILSDFGATVTRIERPNAPVDADFLTRGKRSAIVDLKHPRGREVLKKLCTGTDVVIEPFRPGVMEKLGLGPTSLHQVNPALVYARLTGFGQDGPFSHMAGHDINYLAISGVLSMLGLPRENPTAPVNLLADFAGGGLICALGICMALYERTRSGKGQVIDASMVEGAAYVGSFLWQTTAPSYPIPIWETLPGKNLLTGDAPFYRTYATRDRKFVAVGSLEPQFYQQLLKGLDVCEEDCPQMSDWDETVTLFRKIFATKTRSEWCKIFDFKDACVTPVLTLDEAGVHPHSRARRSFVTDANGIVAPAPAPVLSRTPASPDTTRPTPGSHTADVLKEAGYRTAEIKSLVDEGVVKLSAGLKL